MIDDSVLALLQREPHWRIADCAIPALSHDGYRPELLRNSDKAARLRRAMEAELERHPGDPYACAKLGSLLVSEGDLERGRALLRLGLETCSADALAERYELLLHLAMAEAPHNPTQAEHLYRRAMAMPLQPRVTLAAALNLAGLLLEQADGTADRESTLAEAADLCRTASSAAPELALGWASLGLVERRRGQLGAAIAAYLQALSLEPQQPELHRNLAAAQLLAGDIGGARAGFRQAILLLHQQGQTAAAQALRQQVEPLVKLEA
jgi:tetratricopeptide (TPR) repeat protein